MGWPVQVVGTTGSTSTDLAERARSGERGPAVLAAREQTAGRGRLGRRWQSPPGASLSVSVLWSPPPPPTAWTWMPMVVGLGVLDGLAVMGVRAVLKWPNDVVVTVDDEVAAHEVAAHGVGPVARAGALTGLAKLAGILVDVVTGPVGPVVVAGVGVNLRLPELPDLPALPDLAPQAGTEASTPGVPAPRAASLLPLLPAGPVPPGGDRLFDRTLAAVVTGLERRLTAWGEDPGAASVRADYVAVCSTLGRTVRVGTPTGVREGRAVDVDASGALVLDTGSDRVTVLVGDVTHVR